MTTTFWIEITIMICSIYSGFAWGWTMKNRKMSERIADLEFDNHILEGENESIWQQLYAMTYGDKSEVKLVEESSLENSIKNHPSNGNKEVNETLAKEAELFKRRMAMKDKINEHFGRDF
jgi:hypothetical protein